MFNWHVGFLGISSVKQLSKYTSWTSARFPLQRPCEFKTVFIVILKCHLLFFHVVGICTEGG